MSNNEASAPLFALQPRGGLPPRHITTSRAHLRLTYLTLRDQGASALDYTPLYQGPDGHWYTCQQQLV